MTKQGVVLFDLLASSVRMGGGKESLHLSLLNLITIILYNKSIKLFIYLYKYYINSIN